METFSVNTKFYFGENALQALADLNLEKVFIVCDPFLVENHFIEKLTNIIDNKQGHFQIFSKIVPDPTVTVVSACVSAMSSFKPTLVIALGGGSALDTAKAVCKIYSEMLQLSQPLFVAIPTTSGTGSEVTSFAVISDEETQSKYPIIDDSLIPDIAILDPLVTLSVPPKVTADTGMDVLTHCLEAYVSTKANDFTDACAEKAMQMVFHNLVQAEKHGLDVVAREKMHNASALAGIAFNGASLGICHSMAHALGGMFHIPHGRANAMLLPHVIAFNAGLEDATESATLLRYVTVANLLGISAGTNKATVYQLIQRIRRLMQQMSMPITLSEYGLDQGAFLEKVPEMAQNALKDNCTLTNPRIVTVADFEGIYRKL